MPQIPIIGVQSQVAPADVAGGNGGPGINEMTGAIGKTIALVGEMVQRRRTEQAQQRSILAVTNDASQENVTSRQAFTGALNSGSIDGFTQRWLKDYDARTAEGAKAIPAIGQPLYAQHRAQMRGQLWEQFQGAETQATQDRLASDFGGVIDSAARSAQADPNGATDAIARNRAVLDFLDVPPAVKDKLRARSDEAVSYAAGSALVQRDPASFLTRAGVGSPDPAAAADALKRDPLLSAMKPENLQHLTQHAQALVAQGRSVADRAQAESERIGQQEYNRLVDFTNQGQAPSLDYVAQVTQATAGTSFAAPAQEVLKRATSQAGFGSQSLPRQREILAGLDARFTDSGTDPDNAKMRANLGAIADRQAAAFKDDPLDAFTRYGKGQISPPQPIASVDQAIEVIAERAQKLPAIETYGGVPGVSPLHPQEAQQLGVAIRHLPLDQQASALSQIGGALGSEARIGALAKQMGDQDGTLGQAMAYAGMRTTQGRDVAYYVLRGAQAFKDKTVEVDSSKVTGWRASIASEIRGAYPNEELADAAVDTALKITAGLEAAGVSSGDTERAVRLATGGIVMHGNANAKIPLPYGMTESDFDKRLAAVTPATLKPQAPNGLVYVNRAPVHVEDFVKSLPSATLVHAGQGRYVVQAGSRYVANVSGAPIILEFHP